MRYPMNTLATLSVALLAMTACTATTEDAVDLSRGATSTAVATDVVDEADAPADSADDESPTDGTAGLDLQEIVRRIGDGYQRIDGRWPGFVPTEHPTVLALKTSDGELDGALAINFPDPNALGDAQELSTEGTNIGSVHHITNLIEADKLADLSGFDFHMKIGDVDSFAMEAGGPDSFFTPTTNDYVATLLHEMFHRWQDESFSGNISSQDVEGYAYTADNIELAALEDRALIDAAGATTDADREAAARRFAGLRLARIAADDRVGELDTDQERFEGTARYIEHLLAGTDEDYSSFTENDYSVDLFADPAELPGIKEHYGFGRFYASGASILGLLDALGAEGVTAKIEGGFSPAEVLIDFMSVTDADAPGLVEEAKQLYDPQGELVAKAEDAAATAVGEPPVFGDDGFGGGDLEGDEDGIALTDDDLACLNDRGIDLIGGDQPTDEDIEACLVS